MYIELAIKITISNLYSWNEYVIWMYKWFSEFIESLRENEENITAWKRGIIYHNKTILVSHFTVYRNNIFWTKNICNTNLYTNYMHVCNSLTLYIYMYICICIIALFTAVHVYIFWIFTIHIIIVVYVRH